MKDVLGQSIDRSQTSDRVIRIFFLGGGKTAGDDFFPYRMNDEEE